MFRPPKVILLSASETETAQLEQALGEYVSLTPVNDPSALEPLLEKENYDALFCGWSFPRATWSDILQDVQELHPELPVIVLAPAPDVRVWAEVVEAGAFDLLVPPFEDRAVLATLEQASLSQQALNSRQDELGFRA